MPCAVSGRRYTIAALSSTGPMNVLNIRLNMRGADSVPFMPHAGHCPSGVPGVALDLGIVGTKALLAVLAIDERIGEAGDVAARLPHPRMHQDRRVEPLDVVARAHHRVPPAVLEFLFSSTPSGP